MAFDPSRLKTQLLNTGLSVKDQPQYQLINSMIDAISSLTASVTNIINNNSTSTIINNVGQFSVLLEDFSAFDEGILGSPYGNLSSVHTGSGLNGQVTFWTSAVNQSGDNGLFWDNTNKRLGIGTATPVNNLHISVDGSTPNSSLFSATDQLIISNTGATQLRLLASGIGIATQIGGMKVGGTLASPSATTTGDNLFGVFGQGYDGTTKLTASRIVFACEGTISSGILPGNIQISTTNTSGAITEAIRIDSGQRVGIGTTAPLAKLEVVGVSQTPTDHSTHFELSTGTGVLTDNKLVFGVHDGDYSWIQAVKAGTNYFNLILNPQGGNVGIGTASPGCILDVVHTIRASSIAETAPTSGTGIEILYDSGTPAGVIRSFDRTGGLFKQLNIDGKDLILNPFSGGNVGIGTTTPAVTLHVVGTTVNYPIITKSQIGTNLLGLGVRTGVTNGTPAVQGFNSTFASTIDISLQPEGGSVGIGTATPARILTVFAGATTSRILLQNTTSGQATNNGLDVTHDGTNSDIWNYMNGYLRFATNNTERMRLFASGGLNLNGTSDPGLANFRIVGAAGNPNIIDLIGGAFSAANTGSQLNIGSNTSGSGAPGLFNLNDRTGVNWHCFVDTLGALRIGSTIPTENGGACDLIDTIVGFQTEKNNLTITYDGATKSNDQNPGTGNVLRVTNNGTNTNFAQLTGLTGGVAGRFLVIFNDDSQTLRILKEDTGSTAANRFYNPAGAAFVLVNPGTIAFVYYSGDQSRWVVSA